MFKFFLKKHQRKKTDREAPTLSPRRSAILYRPTDEGFHVQVERNMRGIELKRQGAVEEAIQLYEQNIAEGFVGNHPYDSLADIYRQRKQYDEEIRVLKKAIEVFSELKETSPRTDVEPKLNRFIKRLAKVEELKRISESEQKK